MSVAQIPLFEKDRIQALEMLHLLDTVPEKEFTDLVHIAAHVFGTPVATITLIDDKRQWFKAKIGVEENEIARDFSFCAHAILDKKPLVILDTLLDSRFADNPFVKGPPHLRFYAGMPIYTPDGFAIGTINVIDVQPRSLTLEQIKILEQLSDQVTQLLSLRLQLISAQTLAKQSAFKAAAIESLSEGIILRSPDSKVIDFNQAALSILGLRASDLLGKTSAQIASKTLREDGSDFPPDEYPASICLKTRKPQRDVIMGLKNTLDLRWALVNSVPFFLDGPEEAPHVITTFTDVTSFKNLDNQQKDLQARLNETARLSSLGEMAGGIAHEINNPLAIISGRINRLQTRFEAGDIDAAAALVEFEKLDKAVERIAKIVRGLKIYARDAGQDPFIESDLSAIVDETIALCRERFRLQLVNLKFEMPEPIVVNCRPAQISQIVMNLLSNAYDAISELNEKWIDVKIESRGPSAVIKVTDSGNGIPSDTIKKMMQPFFTTKDVGKGTGLGLSISQGLAEVHGGTLAYDHASAHTCFVFTLPLAHSVTNKKTDRKQG